MATETSSTGRDSDKFMLRFPDGMRDRIAEAAKAANRSMNAEIVARLEQSFESKPREDGRQFMELLVSNMQSQVEMLGLRIEMVKMRARSEEDRLDALMREIELETKAAQTDDDFERVSKKVEALSANRALVAELQKELVGILREREVLIAHLTSTQKLFTTARQELEGRMAEYKERRSARGDDSQPKS